MGKLRHGAPVRPRDQVDMSNRTFSFSSHEQRIGMIYERVIHGTKFEDIATLYNTSKSTANLVYK